MPRLSVIIPSYNQAIYLPSTLDSLLAQTYRDFEIIVVDDGSTDDTDTVLAHYQGQIQSIHQDNKGLSSARNSGFAASRGEYIYFLDSDDLLLPNALENFVAYLDSHPDCALVYSAWQQITSDGTRVLDEVHPHHEGHVLKELLLREFFFFASMTIIRRNALKKVGLFDEELTWSDDADMWLRLAQAGCIFGYIDEPVVQYRVHMRSMSAAVTLKQIEGWQTGLKKFFSIPDLAPDIRILEPQAYSVLHYETAGRYYRAREVEEAKAHLIQAVRVAGKPDKQWFLSWLAGTARDPRTSDPLGLINTVFAHLPSEAEFLRSLRRRAYGEYYIASIFAAYYKGDFKAVRRYILPAIFHNPAILKNRGFWRASVQSWLGRWK